MKKLMVLALVLGMASLATAALSLSASSDRVNPGEEFTIYVMGTVDELPASGGLDGAIEGPMKWNSYGLSDKVGVGVVADSWDAFGTLDFNIGKGGAPLPETADGAWVVATYVAGAAGESYDFYLQDSSFTTIPASLLTVTVIPEPVTMALLGLGGLFLRRRSA